MKTLNFVKIFLLCLFSLSAVSCGDDVYYTMQNEDAKLCGKKWVEDTETDGNVASAYQLVFEMKGNRGYEISTTYTEDGKVTYEKELTWNWTDDSKEALKLTFVDGKVKYFENVWVRDHYLSGILDGEYVILTDADYKKRNKSGNFN